MGGSKGGLLGGVMEPLFGDGGARAAGRAAMAQQSAAGQGYQNYANIVNPATTAGLLSLDKDIANQEKNLSRQEQMIAQIDPTIIEASQQALRLLKGEQSSALAPAQRQREQQRQTLLNTLREQLGPGAENSTAGMQAISRFDSETNNLLANQQQAAIQNLGGVAGQFNAVRPDMFREISGLSNFGQAKTGLQFNQAQGLLGAWNPVMQNAGAQYTKDVLMGQQQSAFGQTLLGTVATLGAGMLSGAGATKTLGNSLAQGAAQGLATSAGQNYRNFGNQA